MPVNGAGDEVTGGEGLPAASGEAAEEAQGIARGRGRDVAPGSPGSDADRVLGPLQGPGQISDPGCEIPQLEHEKAVAQRFVESL